MHCIGITGDLLERCSEPHQAPHQHRANHLRAGIKQGLEVLEVFNLAVLISIRAGHHLPSRSTELEVYLSGPDAPIEACCRRRLREGPPPHLVWGIPGQRN